MNYPTMEEFLSSLREGGVEHGVVFTDEEWEDERWQKIIRVTRNAGEALGALKVAETFEALLGALADRVDGDAPALGEPVPPFSI